MMIITSDRVRAIISGCKSEMEAAHQLRAHKVKYTFATDSGFTSIRIPCRKGCIRVYRTCSRSAPLAVRSEHEKAIVTGYHVNYQ